ncbi:MAG: methyltransferase domain-containing protein [Deltaproteobacteria bacterium]|nr:methyltransferase domain-containing protein [Deltaproteobacteria bacterium]
MGEVQTKISGAVRRKYNVLSFLYDHIWPGYIKKTIGSAIEPIRLTGSESLLDIGCGTGELERILVSKYQNLHIVGLDISDDMLELARKKLLQYPKIILKRGDFLNIDLAENSFDAAFSISNLHYFPNPSALFEKTHRLLKKNGKFVIIDWNRNSFQGKLYNGYMNLADPSFVKAYIIEEVVPLLEKAGFQFEKVDYFKVGIRWRMMRIVSKKI